MKKNYTTKAKKIRNLLLTITIIGCSAMIVSFGPMFFGPGLTNPEPFDPFVDTTFSPLGIASDPYEVAFSNLDFDTPLNFNIVPGQNRIVLGQRDGKVFWFPNDDNTAQKNLLVDFSAEVGGAIWDGGFLGLAIHPDFGTAGKNYFYIYYTSKSSDTTLESPLGFSCGLERFHDNYLYLERFEVNPTDLSYIVNSKQTMIKRRMYNTTHRGGGMEFGNDGFLYLSTGDQAAYLNAQDITENLDGGVLRIDVDMIGGATSHAPIRTLLSPGAGEADEFSGIGYFIPNDNPFPSPTGDTFEEYYSLGHRNPHRLTKDRATGTFYIGEIGENTHEEINVLSAGKNYGWPLYEATLGPNTSCVPQLLNNMPHEEPLVEFQRSEANSIIGGYVYNGTNISGLQGKYICADYGSGNEIWQVNTGTGEKQLMGNFAPGNPVSFGQDYQGELYILSYGNGVKLYRLTSAISLNAAPALLSQTGAFTDLPNLTVADGFFPYDMVEPFWSDGAQKTRWLAIPNNGTHDTAAEQIQFSENGDWQFPEGSIIIKHFDYPIDDNNPAITRKVETRFSIKGTNGEFYFLTYKWRADESDADLIDMEVGDNENIVVTTNGGGSRNVNWRYPSNTECISCHSPALGGTVGPRTRFLNKDFDYVEKGGSIGNQLVTLSALGILNENITDTDTPGYLTHVAMDDLNGTLEEKARSYLDNNCAYCHQPATGNRAEFDLRLLNNLSQTKLLTAGINQPIPGLGGDQRIVYPGDASKSQLYHRANSTIPGIMMPPIAKGIVDAEGVALLEAWINQLQPPVALPAAGNYRIVNRGSGETLQIPDGNTALGANVANGSYEGLPKQHFELEETVEGYYYFRALNSTNRYIDVELASTLPNTNVWQYQGNASPAQTWEILDAGDGTFNIVSRLSGYYLSHDSTGNVLVVENTSNDDIRWEFLPTNAPFTIGLDIDSDLVVTSEDGTTDVFNVELKSAPIDDIVLLLTKTGEIDEFGLSATELTFTSSDWNIAQTVTVTGTDDVDVDGVQYYQIEVMVDNSRSDSAYAGFTYVLDGYNNDNDGGANGPPPPSVYRIVNVDTGLSMEVIDADVTNEANILEGLYQGESHEQFELISQGGGLYSLVAQHSGKAIDVQGNSPDAGANIWQYTFGNNTTNLAQLWRIQDAGNGTYYIISERGGHYLTVEPNGNIHVNINDSSNDRFKWQFQDIQQLGNAGLTVSQDILSTNENGDTDTFSVVLDEEPTTEVFIGFNVSQGSDEVTLAVNQLSFDQSNWNVEQTVTVTGVDDSDPDGVQDYIIEVLVIAPFNDSKYTQGMGNNVSGLNYDNDGGDNGGPIPGVYQIRNVGNQENIMPQNGTLVWQTNILTGLYDGSEYQHFELVAEGNNLYKIKLTQQDNLGRDLYLDKEGGSSDPGKNVWQYPSFSNVPNPAQLWKVVDAGNGSYHIISALSSGDYLRAEVNGNVSIEVNGNDDFYKWQFLATGFPPEAIATSDIIAGNAPLDVQFSGSSSTDDKNDIVSYLWDFGNGDTATVADPLYTFAVGGTYTVTLTVTDGDGYEDESDPIEITVNGAPEAIASANVITGIAPLEVTFTGDQSIDDNVIVSYNWNFDGSSNATDMNPVFTFVTPGTYNVVLTVTDAGGMEDTAMVTIVVNANIAPIAVASSDVSNGSAPLEVNFVGNQSTDDVGIVSYVWDFGDGTSSIEQNPTHTYVVAGTYEVLLTVMDDGGLDSTAALTIEVTAVNGAPVAVASVDVAQGDAPLEVTFTGDQSTDDVGIVSYSWDFGDGTTSDVANPLKTYTSSGNYEVILTITDGDGLQDTAMLSITLLEGNEAEEPSFEFVLAPNPSIEYVEVIMKDDFDQNEILGVMIHDMSGRLIKQYFMNEILLNGVIRIPTATYRNEVYAITLLFNNNDPVSKRLVIQN